jgi:hypothetical protein
VFSDGFDTDEPELLSAAMQEVRARGARITWFHPTRQVPAAAAHYYECELLPWGLGPVINLPGVTVDDDDAQLTGTWTGSTASASYVGQGYRHDAKGAHGPTSARFEAKLPKAGRYEVFLAVVPNANRATNAKVTLEQAGQTVTQKVDLTKGPANHLLSLGTYDFTNDTPAAVIVSNEGADGFVVIDAVNWLAR